MFCGAAPPPPPAGYNTVKDNYILKGYDPGGWAGSGTGTLEITAFNTLPFDTMVTNPATGLPSLRVNNKTVLPGGQWWKSLTVPRGWATATIGQYWANGNIEFDIKGNAGGEVFKLGLQDWAYDRCICGTGSPNNFEILKTSSSFFNVTTSWQHVSIPLKSIIPAGSQFVMSQFQSFTMGNANSNAMKFWISGIKFTTTDKEPSYPVLKVNQVGYATQAPKAVVVSDWYENLFAVNDGTAFDVKRVSDDTVAFSGTLSLKTDYDDPVSGDKVLRGDFTSLKDPGYYYIAVAGLPKSSPFAIGDTIYDPLLRDAGRYYYFQSANIALTPPYEIGWDHPAWHLDDFNCPLQGTALKFDVHGGWYDAGDYGKYTAPAATAAGDLLWAYELFPARFTDGQLGIPESYNGKPDILDEVKAETDFLLRMQDQTSGGFWNYVWPNNDTTSPRYINNSEPTADGASAVAALAHASIVFQPFDATYATACLNAAKAGWTYLENHPVQVDANGPYPDGVDHSDVDERLWAAAELCRATDNAAAYNTYFTAHYAAYTSELTSTTGFGHGVGGMAIAALFAYMKSPTPDAGFVTWFTTNFATWKADKLSRVNTSAWRNTQLANYFWGSNFPILAVAMDAAIGSKILGTYDTQTLGLVRDEFSYILGINPLSLCYVSNYGANAAQHTFSVTFNNDGKSGEPAGFLAGGPNQYEGGWFSKFRAKCFVDASTEWTTNEHTIYWNSPLIFNTALVSTEAQSPTIPGVPGNFAATSGNTKVDLKWTAAAGAGNYILKRSTVSGGPFTSIGTTGMLTYTDTGLTNGTIYYYVVAAVNGGSVGDDSAQVSATPMPVGPLPPTVAIPASATPSPVTTTKTTLNVLGADDGGEASLTYTWSQTAGPSGPAAPTFSINGNNAAKTTQVTFKKAGDYTFMATIKNPANLTVTSSVSVTVQQTISFIAITPNPTTVPKNMQRQFTATAKDLFGNPLTVQPAFNWTATGGTVTPTTGLFTAGNVAGSFTVSAGAGGKTGNATVNVN
jgi:endoglucanase